MSVILDALRKADEERDVAQVPTLVRMRVDAEEPGRRILPWIVAVALLAGSAAGIWTWPDLPARIGGVASDFRQPLERAADTKRRPELRASRSAEDAPPADPAPLAAPSDPSTAIPPTATKARPRTSVSVAVAVPSNERAAPVVPEETTPAVPQIGAVRGDAPSSGEFSGPVLTVRKGTRTPADEGTPLRATGAAPPTSAPAQASVRPSATYDSDTPAAATPDTSAATVPSAANRAPDSATAPVKAEVAPAPPPTSSPLREAMAKMRLNVVIYSERSADRKVYIGGRGYLEGELVDGKFLLEEIRVDGAVLKYRAEQAVLRPPGGR
jgi:hypothetical protein